MDPELRRSLDELIETNKRLAYLQSGWRYFGRGVIYGIGATVGAAMAIAVVAGLLHQMSGVDLFRPFAQQVLPYVERQGRLIDPDNSLPTPRYSESPVSEVTPTPSPEAEPSPTPTLE